jgi:hypothetical protein
MPVATSARYSRLERFGAPPESVNDEAPPRIVEHQPAEEVRRGGVRRV